MGNIVFDSVFFCLRNITIYRLVQVPVIHIKQGLSRDLYQTVNDVCTIGAVDGFQ